MTGDSVERIERLKELRNSGDITDAEYDAMKAEVLSDIGGSARVEPEPEPYVEPTVHEPVHHSQKFCALAKLSIPRNRQAFNAPCPSCGVPLPAKKRYVMVSYDSDGKVVSHEAKPGPPWWRTPAIVVGSLLLLLSFMLVSNLADDGSSGSSRSSAGPFSGSVVDYFPENPASLTVVIEMKNLGKSAGNWECSVSASDNSGAYSGFDTLSSKSPLAAGGSKTYNGSLVITNEGAAYVTEVTLKDCKAE